MPPKPNEAKLLQLVLLEENIMRWEPQAFDAMLERLKHPDLTPSPAMQESLRKPRIWERR